LDLFAGRLTIVNRVIDIYQLNYSKYLQHFFTQDAGAMVCTGCWYFASWYAGWPQGRCLSRTFVPVVKMEKVLKLSA
jgi:hypothetical protein